MSTKKRAKSKKTKVSPDVPLVSRDTSGVAWITGTSIKVIEIIFDKLAHGGTSREIKTRFAGISLKQIDAALDYFRRHQDEFQTEIERRWEQISRLGVRDADSPFERRLNLLKAGTEKEKRNKRK